MRRGCIALLALGSALGLAATAAAVVRDNAPSPQAVAALKACQDKGLTPGTDAFKQCVNSEASQPAANSSLTPKQLAAFDACKAKGLVGASDALKRCLEKQLTTVTKAVRAEAEAELKAAVAACNAKKLKTADLVRQCLQARLGK